MTQITEYKPLEDEDSEYDYFAGNDDRYDSRLDDFDELKFVKDTLQEMS